MSIEREFIPHEQALALKELGFDELCLMWYNKTELVFNYNKNTESWQSKNTCSAPLYQQAFRWFRDKYNLMIPIYKDDIGQYYFSIPNSDRLLDTTNYCSESYEEAELECLKKLIEIVKNK